MKKIGYLITFMTLLLMLGLGCTNTQKMKNTDLQQPLKSEVKILQSWQEDYPTTQLNLLPENQRENAVGFIGNTETFNAAWNAFKPEELLPVIDFNTNFVIFAKNTQFYNRIRIVKVNVTNGVAEVLSMETKSAMPIEDRVAMSLVLVGRQGITGIRNGNEIIPIKKIK